MTRSREPTHGLEVLPGVEEAPRPGTIGGPPGYEDESIPALHKQITDSLT
jgi:hypothetical protein